VDVGGFAEPRKILCQCAIRPLSNYQHIPGRKSPTGESTATNKIDPAFDVLCFLSL